MRPQNLYTKIFLDSGDANETKEILKLLGFLDGQTTNPTLIAKNPEVKKRIDEGKKFLSSELLEFYKNDVKKISDLIPNGSVSIEVYADKKTTGEQMFEQGKEMFSWIPNAHIKFPTTKEGLKAASQAIKEHMRVNMTHCFSEQQAAAVYSATAGAERGQVFISPFIGRLDDIGFNGLDLVSDILRLYKKGDGHVQVLAASVRTLDDLLYCLKLRTDIITAPFQILKEWSQKNCSIPDEHFNHHSQQLKDIPYQEIDLSQSWESFNISHDLTNKGIEKFSNDWNSIVSKG